MKLLDRLLGMQLPDVKETAAAMVAEEQEKLKTQETFLLSLQLGLLPNGQVRMYFSWPDGTDEIGKATASFLKKLNAGEYSESFEEVLIAYANENMKMQPFIEIILHTWRDTNDKKRTLVKPRNALRANQE